MKSLTPELALHYAQETTTLARLWRVTRRDGEVLTFTDHDEPIVYESVTYQTTSSYDASAISTSSAMNVDNAELVGLLAVDAVTAADIEAGLWDKGTVELMEVNYEDLTMGHNDLRFGEIGEVQRKGPGQFTAELRGLMQYLQNNIGRVVTAHCDADFGDARCGYDRESLRVTGTVSVATSQRIFTATYGAPVPIATYGIGEVTWLTGLNAGLRMEMKSLTGPGVHTLQLDMPYAVAIGNTFTIVPGCNKIGRLGHCVLIYDNYLNFRGFEDVPGIRKVSEIGGQGP